MNNQLFTTTLETKHFIFLPIHKDSIVPQEVFNTYNRIVTQHTVVNLPSSCKGNNGYFMEKQTTIEEKSFCYSIRCKITNLLVGFADLCPKREQIILNCWTTKLNWNKKNVVEMLEGLILNCTKILPSQKISIRIPRGEVFFTNIITEIFLAKRCGCRFVRCVNGNRLIEYYEYFIE